MAIDLSSLIPGASPLAAAGIDPDEALASGDPEGMLAAKQAGVAYVPRNLAPRGIPQVPISTPQPANNAPNPSSEPTRNPVIPGTVTPTGKPQSQFSDMARQALTSKLQSLGQASQTPAAPDVAALQAQRTAAVSSAPNPNDPQYKPSIGRRIARGFEGVGLGLAEGGLRGAIAGGLAPQTTGVVGGYSSPNSKFSDAARQNAGLVSNLNTQIGDAQDREKARDALVKSQTEIAGQYGTAADQATTAENAENKPSSDLRKYQIITAGDGSMFRINPDDPKSAEPILGPDGKQVQGKTDGKYVQLEIGGKPHTVEVDDKGNTIKDLGATGEKPTNIHVGEGGTWSLQEDKDGKSVLLNSKTGETRDAGGIQKSGTSAKNQAATEKLTEPVNAALNFANGYLQRGGFTGPDDEALMEKYFELAKPSTGFRMSQPQIDMLKNARDWAGSLEAQVKHAATPNSPWFSDTQRQQIVNTMRELGKARLDAVKQSGGGSSGSSTGGGQFSVQAPDGKSYQFKDQASADNFKKEAGIK